MRALCLALILALATPLAAQDWQRLTGPALAQTLTAHPLTYEDGASQVFRPDGVTLYRQGAGESLGRWWVEDGLYCSTWPPSEAKACYQVDLAAPQIRFVSESGAATLGQFSP